MGLISALIVCEKEKPENDPMGNSKLVAAFLAFTLPVTTGYLHAVESQKAVTLTHIY